MATIRIRVTAAADASLSSVFQPLHKAAAQAKKVVSDDLAGAAKTAGEALKTMPAAARPAFDNLGTLAAGTKKRFDDLATSLKGMPVELRVVAQEAQKALEKIERERARTTLGLTKAPLSVHDQEWTRELNRRARLQARQDLGIVQRQDAIFGRARDERSFSVPGALLGVAGRVGLGAVSFGQRAAADLLQGIGVNTDLASMFHQQVSLESAATRISNSGFMPGDARNGARIAPQELIAQARQVGTANAIDPTQALGGLSAFVGKTGDLATGREVLGDLARLSKATGTNLEDMVDAAGDVSNTLGDIPDKGKAVYEVMKQIAGQGKLGAVEIRDLASQMAKVAAGAQLFAGDRGHNIETLSAIAQEARQRGGSASATQAATSVSSFVNTFSKAARLRAFEGFGVRVQDASGAGLRDAQGIITDSLVAAMRGGSRLTPQGHHVAAPGGLAHFSENMGAMFMDVRARSAVRGFESIFQQTFAKSGGTEQERLAAATQAVTEEFDRLKSAAMSEAEISESFKAAMATTESTTQQFNNKLSETVGAIEEKLLPVFKDHLAPLALELAQAFRDVIDFLVIAGVVKDRGKEGDQKHARDIVDLGQKALNAVDQTPTRFNALTGERVPISHDAIPTIPAGLQDELGRSLSVARTHLTDEQQKLAENRRQAGKFGYDEAAIASAFSAGPEADYIKFSYASKLVAGEKAVEGAQRDVDTATAVEQGVKAALGSGRLEVVLVEDRTARGGARVDDSSRMPAEAKE